jgi:hypothetical protein
MKTAVLLSICTAAIATSVAQAGVTILVADRTAHKIWRLTDLNNDGMIDASEVFVWFDGTNAAGTPNISNIGAFALRPSDNTVVAGDIALHQYYWFKDLNNDGNALGPGESRVIITASNASGATTNVPSGVAFMANGDLLIDNSGSGTNPVFPDAIYRCHDIDNNGDYMGPGEITPWVFDGPSGFGGGNSSTWVPQDLLMDANGTGFMHNAGAVAPGVYKFRDANNNGRADDAGEFTPWFTSANLSGVTVSPGFPIEPDTSNPGALYYLQTATGSVDQVYRLRDNDNNGDANGTGEAVLVYSTAEANFTSNDLLLLPGGRPARQRRHRQADHPAARRRRGRPVHVPRRTHGLLPRRRGARARHTPDGPRPRPARLRQRGLQLRWRRWHRCGHRELLPVPRGDLPRAAVHELRRLQWRRGHRNRCGHRSLLPRAGWRDVLSPTYRYTEGHERGQRHCWGAHGPAGLVRGRERRCNDAPRAWGRRGAPGTQTLCTGRQALLLPGQVGRWVRKGPGRRPPPRLPALRADGHFVAAPDQLARRALLQPKGDGAPQ